MSCRSGASWLHKLTTTFSWESGHAMPEDLVFRDRNGTVRLILERSGRIIVTKGYAWNGCSPKVCLFDVLVGTPEGVVHAEKGVPKTPAWIYWAAVRVFGRLVWALTRWKRGWRGSRERVAELVPAEHPLVGAA